MKYMWQNKSENSRKDEKQRQVIDVIVDCNLPSIQVLQSSIIALLFSE